MSRATELLCQEALARLGSSAADRLVWRRRELLDVGIPDSLQAALFTRGHIVRLRHGVYVARALLADADPAGRHRIDVAAAVAAASEPIWAVGPSAALLRGLPLPYPVPDRLHLLRTGHQDTRSLNRPSTHRLKVPPSSIMSLRDCGCEVGHDVQGIPCVALSTTAVTAALAVTGRWRVALFDAALWRGGATRDELIAAIARWRHLGHTGELTKALAQARSGAQTVLETMSRLALVREGLPEPDLQVEFADRDGFIGRVDMWWPALGVVGEADGLVKYARAEDVIREKLREDRLRALGLMVVRWTWEEIRAHPASVAARIRDASHLARRAAG